MNLKYLYILLTTCLCLCVQLPCHAFFERTSTC